MRMPARGRSTNAVHCSTLQADCNLQVEGVNAVPGGVPILSELRYIQQSRGQNIHAVVCE